MPRREPLVRRWQIIPSWDSPWKKNLNLKQWVLAGICRNFSKWLALVLMRPAMMQPTGQGEWQPSCKSWRPSLLGFWSASTPVFPASDAPGLMWHYRCSHLQMVTYRAALLWTASYFLVCLQCEGSRRSNNTPGGVCVCLTLSLFSVHHQQNGNNGQLVDRGLNRKKKKSELRSTS